MKEEHISRIIQALAVVVIGLVFSTMLEMEKDIVRVIAIVEQLEKSNERLIGIVLEVHPLSNRGGDE